MALARQISSTGQGGRVVKLPIPVYMPQSRLKTENNEKVSGNKSSPSSFQAGASNKLAPTRYPIQSSTERKPAPAVPPKPSNLLKNDAINKSSRNNAPSITQTEIFSSAPSLKDTSCLTTEKLKSPDTSKLVSITKNLKSNISDSCQMSSPRVQPTQEEVSFPKERTVSNEDDRYSSRPKNLADTYQSVTSKIREVGAAATRDPVIRRDISTTFKEINIVLCGSPRVGKSTLINAICQQMLAKTTPGLDSCTHAISRYHLKEL
ncbi:unnamed protein product [Rotaria sordida]|uniref:G domain-containing protein n=1 Tax=Rotaria sordida TaxID=392033 RepID=A0A814EBU3_9BILA|nr:unnamed protein product [Rotaria sordida]CAF3880874.1 unnamed protein product [Rotaria sordida]